MRYLLFILCTSLPMAMYADIIDYRENTTDLPNDDPVIFFKAGVNIEQLNNHIIDAFPTIIKVYQSYGITTPVITSGNDGKHRKGSAHYSNLAIDLRANNISRKKSSLIAYALQKELGEDFKVIFEAYEQRSNDHIHLEYILPRIQFISNSKIN